MAARVFQLPNKSLICTEQIHNTRILKGGIGIFDDRNRMIGWIQVEDEAEIELVLDILFEIRDNPRHFVKPDWSFLTSSSRNTGRSTTVSASQLAPQPTRRNRATSGSGGTTNAGDIASGDSESPSSTNIGD